MRHAVGRLVGSLEQQGARATGGIVNRLILLRARTDAHHLRHHLRDLGGCVELALALAGLGGEVAHQVFVSVAEQIVPFRPVSPEIKSVEDSHQLREPVLHVLAGAELRLVVEVRLVDDAFKLVGLGEPADNLVDLVADLLVAL